MLNSLFLNPNILHELVEILKNSIYITGLVIIMMLVIEYFNVSTKGDKLANVQKSPLKQVLIGASLGLIPGCMGGFVAVSLFSHNIFGFGALLATLISDTGDETFVMFASMPKQALIIKACTFTLGITLGLLVNTFAKKYKMDFEFDHDLEIHHHEEDSKFSLKETINNFKKLSLKRAILLFGVVLFIVGLASGKLEHDHDAHSLNDSEHVHQHSESCDSHDHNHDFHSHDEEHVHAHTHNHSHHNGNFFFSERWLNILFILVALVAIWIVSVSSEHFLREHMWDHVVRKHFLQIFAWTFGSLLFIFFLNQLVQFDTWMSDNRFIVLLIAIAIGIIPQSGPHIMFISLFLSGQIGLSVLLANSIVQSGHSGLPLLAASKKGFVKVKIIAIIAALIIGTFGYLFKI